MASAQLTLVTLEELHHTRERERTESEHVAAQAAELDALADGRFADAGAHLVPRRAWWRPPAEVVPWLAEAERRVAHIRALDERLERLREHGRANPGPLRWLQGQRYRAAGWERDRAGSRLRSALVMIARVGGAAGSGVPDVAPLLEEAADLQARARHLRFSLSSIALRLADLDREIGRREQAARVMGFDSIHMVSRMTEHGLPEIESPFELEGGEAAYLALPASLARPPSGSSYVSRGAGLVPPADLTGIQHWLGAFRDAPAPIASAPDVDAGVLFLSNLRLAFAGGAGSSAIWLDALVDMDVYRDAVAVFHLGAENPLLIQVTEPRLVAFYVNWAMRSALALGVTPQG